MSKRRGLPDSSRMRHDSHYVEQLVRADELPIGRKISMHLIEANPDQPRSVLGDLSDLKQSIAKKGVLEPILVRPKADGRFTIISGERRYRAAMDAGLAEIPCIEMDVPDAELLEIALIENLQRKDLTPFEEADGYLALQEKYQYTHEQIAQAVGKSRVTITEALGLTRLPFEVKEECRRADIASKSFLLELGRLGSAEAMLAAIESYRRIGSSRDILREAKRAGAGGQGVSSGPLRKAYSLDFDPADRAYRVSLVLRGEVASREEILAAVKDLLKRIEVGDVDLEKHGRFARPRKQIESEPTATSQDPDLEVDESSDVDPASENPSGNPPPFGE